MADKAPDKWLKFRETEKGLQELDEALKFLGYRNRADWYSEQKRKIMKEYEERKKHKND